MMPAKCIIDIFTLRWIIASVVYACVVIAIFFLSKNYRQILIVRIIYILSIIQIITMVVFFVIFFWFALAQQGAC